MLVSNEAQRKDAMSDIYAVCLSVSQSIDAPRATAHLTVTVDGRHTNLRVEWGLPHPINADGNASEWLYAVLSRLVQDFDDHIVTRAEVDGEGTTEEGRSE